MQGHSKALTKEHEKCCHYQENRPIAKYKVGDAVWLERRSKFYEHRQATYYVPAKVQKRTGKDTYTLKVAERLYQNRNHSQMKPRVRDPGGKHGQLNYADLEVDNANPFTEEPQYNASKILMCLRGTSSRRNKKDLDEHTTHGSRRRRSFHATPSASSTSLSAARLS